MANGLESKYSLFGRQKQRVNNSPFGVAVPVQNILETFANRPVTQQDPISLNSTYFKNRGLELGNQAQYDPFHREQYSPWPGAETPFKLEMPSPWDRYSEAVIAGQPAVSPESLQARLLGADSAAQTTLNRALDKIPVYHEGEYTPSPYPKLELPDAPQRQAPKLDPVSGALAAIAGLIAPQYAGSFAAEPLRAGIADAQQRYEDAQRDDAQRMQRLMIMHQNAIEQREDAIRTDNMNRNIRRGNSEAEIRAAMEKAQRQYLVDAANGKAGVYNNVDALNAPALKSKTLSGLLEAEMNARMKQSDQAQARSDSYLQEGVNLKQNEDRFDLEKKRYHLDEMRFNADQKQVARQWAAAERERKEQSDQLRGGNGTRGVPLDAWTKKVLKTIVGGDDSKMLALALKLGYRISQ